MNTRYHEALAHFERIALTEAQESRGRQWIGKIENCDVCSRPMEKEPYMVDGPASKGPHPRWGNMCVICAFKYAPDIAWGKAQLYKRTSDDYWSLVAGGPPDRPDDEDFY